jgi:hypothetical protein
MVGGAIRSKLIHRMSYRASVLHQLWTKHGEKNTAREFCVLTTPSLLSKATRQLNRLKRAQKLHEILLFLLAEFGAKDHVEVFHGVVEREQTPVMQVGRRGEDTVPSSELHL